MPDQTITCPTCGAVIPLTETLTATIRHDLEHELKKDVLAREQALKEREKHLDTELTEKIEAEKRKLWEVAQQKAEEKSSLKLQDLERENAEKEKQLAEARVHELELRQKTRDLEAREKNLQIDFERRIDSERRLIAEQAKKETSDELHMKIAEKDKQMEQLQRALEEARRKAEQGSQQVQGDAQENDLKAALAAHFPYDAIDDVPTGIRGADLVQRVHTQFGEVAGTLLWESKNTKAWSDSWIKKLKDDQIIAKADVCLLVSQVLPSGMEHFGQKEGIYIVSYQYALALASILRTSLLELSHTRKASVGKNEKMEQLYAYLSGSEFRTRMESIIHAFRSMRSDLETEKRSMQRIWSKREKEIERVVSNTTGLYGDMQGIIGAGLPSIPALELTEDDEDQGEQGRLLA